MVMPFTKLGKIEGETSMNQECKHKIWLWIVLIYNALDIQAEMQSESLYVVRSSEKRSVRLQRSTF